MRPYMYVVIVAVTFAYVSIASAQTQTIADDSGQDYFTTKKCEQCYLTIVEGAHVRSISRWLSQGRINDALADIRYTLDRFPNHPVSLQQLGMIAQMVKNNGLAVNYFERAVTLYPQYALTRAQYGLFLVSINDVDGGIAKFNQAIEIDPKLSVGYAGLAHGYAKKGDLEQARAAAQKARELGFNGKLPDGL